MYDFDVVKPATVAEAVTALGQDEAQPLSGGQTLIPTLKARLAMPSVLVSLSGIEEMRGVRMGDDGQLCVGGGTVHATLSPRKHRRITLGWRVLPRGSVIRRCVTAARLAGPLPTMTPLPVIRPPF